MELVLASRKQLSDQFWVANGERKKDYVLAKSQKSFL